MTEAASDLTPAPIPAPASGDAVAPWRILCVDDEANILSALRRLFRQNGYQISVVLKFSNDIRNEIAAVPSSAGFR